MKRLSNLDRILDRIVTAVVAVLFLAMLMLSIVQVALRLLLNTGVIWADPLTRRLVLWVCLLGAVLATGEEKHFQLDLLWKFLPPAAHRPMRLVSRTLAGIICLLMVSASINFLQATSGERDTALLSVPAVAVECIIPLAFLLMGLEFFLRAALAWSTDGQKTARGTGGEQ